MKVFISRFLNSAVVVLLVAADGFPVKGLGSQRRVVNGNSTQAHDIAEVIFASVGVRQHFTRLDMCCKLTYAMYG